jgi:hypothetical protein
MYRPSLKPSNNHVFGLYSLQYCLKVSSAVS